MKTQPRHVRGEDHLYSLQSHPSYYFEVGRSETHQLLWGFLGDAAYVLHFDASGVLKRVERDGVLPDGLRGGLPAALRSLSSRLRSEWSLRAAPISVKRFWLDQGDAGIEDLGDDLKEFLDAPSSFSDEEREELQGALDEWIEGGMFILWWEQAFEVNAAGEVETS